jgi:hypothetical protein
MKRDRMRSFYLDLRLVWRSRVSVKEYSSKIVDRVIPQKIRDGVTPGLTPSYPSLAPNQTDPYICYTESYTRSSMCICMSFFFLFGCLTILAINS